MNTGRTYTALARGREGSKGARGVGLALEKKRRKCGIRQQDYDCAEQQRCRAVGALHEVAVGVSAAQQRQRPISTLSGLRKPYSQVTLINTTSMRIDQLQQQNTLHSTLLWVAGRFTYYKYYMILQVHPMPLSL